MSVRITQIRLSGGFDHRHITHLRWVGMEDGHTDTTSNSLMVAWIENGGQAYVFTGSSVSQVGVVSPFNGTRYLRTYADGQWSDNLLALPRF